MFDSQKFGNRLKQLRLLNNLTQQQLSDALSISLNYTYKLENGSRAPSLDLCIQLSALFDVSMDYLLAGESHQTSPKELIRQAICLLEDAEQRLKA